MASLPIAISPSYISWTGAQCIREFLQNARDAELEKYKMTILYSPKTETLSIRTDGTTLSPSSLVLGETKKRFNDNSAGQFGEGYKLAIIRLLQLGIKLKIKNGSENWIPSIRYSDDFATEILFMDTHKCFSREGEHFIEYVIEGINQDTWNEVQGNTLFIGKKIIDAIDCNEGRILTDSMYQSKLFVKGLFVCDLPEPYKYGYDMKCLALDRDRQIADPWNLKESVKSVIKDAADNGKFTDEQVYMLLSSRTGESNAFNYDYGSAGEFHKAATRYFQETYGDNSIPVSSMAESMSAEHTGLKGIVVNSSLKGVIEKVVGDSTEKTQQHAMDVRCMYGSHELTSSEKENYVWANELVLKSADFNGIINVVDFNGSNINGTHRPGEINLARRIVDNRMQLIATLVHEVAHDYGTDGSIDHERNIENIFAKIVVSLCD